MGDEKEKKEKEENTKIQIVMDLAKLGEVYRIPFEETLKTIKEDRQFAKENYEILKQKLLGGDDTASAKEQMNKAMELIIDSTEKLTSLMKSASQLLGDTAKAMAITGGREKTPQEIAYENEKRRREIVEEENEKKKE